MVTIHVVQVMFIPFMFTYFLKHFQNDLNVVSLTFNMRIKLMSYVIMAFFVLSMTLPLFPSIGLKMLTK